MKPVVEYQNVVGKINVGQPLDMRKLITAGAQHDIGFPGVPADLAIRNLADEIAVSSGSACASATSEPSRVLMALGLDPDTAATGIRISLGRFTTEEDVETAIAALSKIGPLGSQT